MCVSAEKSVARALVSNSDRLVAVNVCFGGIRWGALLRCGRRGALWGRCEHGETEAGIAGSFWLQETLKLIESNRNLILELNHVPKSLIYMYFKPLQRRWLHHFPRAWMDAESPAGY